MICNNPYDEINDLKEAHSAELAELHDWQLEIMRDMLRRYDTLRNAALEVLKHRVGDMPTSGHLRDADASRTALKILAKAVEN
jgi:hypothetical protein